MAKNYAALANDVVSALGGKENIVAVTHCMTRLRFVLKDESLTDAARLKSISGVLGVVRNDNQCQVIIGNTVSQAYREVVSLLPANLQPAVAEGPQKLTLRRIGAGILDALIGTMSPLIPAIIGGSKVSTKISILENLMEKVDSIVIGGGMSYTFAAAQGGKVGNSLCEPEMFPTALEIVKKAEERGVKLVFSPDALIADKFAEDADTRQAPVNDIPDGWMGLDIGEEGKKTFREHILGCKTILWNGPVGVFEMDKFATGSKAVAEAIAEATSKGAFSLIGGGDSVACINKFSLADKVSYVSTGGGALLEYIEGKELPGLAAIRK